MNRSMPGLLSITNSQSPPKPMSIESMMPSNHLIFCGPLLLLPSIFPRIKVFSNESALCIRWPKYWSFSFNISPSNEHPGLISFSMDWLDLLAVQGTLKILSKYSFNKQRSDYNAGAFSIQQSSHVYRFVVVIQSLSHVRLFATPQTAACQASLSFTISQSLLKLMSIESVILSNHLSLCCPLLLLSIFPSIRAFSNESALCTRWPKCWSSTFSINPSSEYSGLISFL